MSSDLSDDLVTWDQIQKARKVLQDSPIVLRTNVLRNVADRLGVQGVERLHLKLENTQFTGSFKIRGVVNQFVHLPEDVREGRRHLVTMSGGNYGRAFAFLMCKRNGLKATVVVPDFAPMNRVDLMRSYGAIVERRPGSEILSTVDALVASDDMYKLHPFDDVNLIAGHASCGLEILEDVPDVDIVLVCCGGGGILAGVAAGIKRARQQGQLQRDVRVYGVEPEGAPKMTLSFQEGRPISYPKPSTIATGLAPPLAGTITYAHAKRFVDGMILVSDAEIARAMKILYSTGLVVEASGAAAVAAVLANKVPDMTGQKVTAVVTGGNVQPDELVKLFATFSD